LVRVYVSPFQSSKLLYASPRAALAHNPAEEKIGTELLNVGIAAVAAVMRPMALRTIADVE